MNMSPNPDPNKNPNIISKNGLSVLNNSAPNLSYSPAQYKQGIFKDSRIPGRGGGEASLVGYKNAMNANDGRNTVIHKNETLYIVAQYISNSVNIMYISIFISLIVLRDKKWFYILLIVFVVNMLGTLLKVFMIRFDYGFLHRPGTCIDEDMTYDFLESNFILDEIKKKVNRSEYNVMGFPTMHMIRATTILALTYLFFPKYKKITGIFAPIYLVFLAWSRIYLNCHTILQVIGGIILGVVASKISFNICK
jgi:membrane-associated phospholipid phosphatase